MDRNVVAVVVILSTGNVALRKESVDRNDGLPEIDTLKLGRSPQGERG